MSPRARLRRLVRDRRGSVAIEFGLVALILIALAAGGLDLANIASLNRDIERSTTQIAAAITSCPASSTPGYLSCTTDTIQQYTDRKANALVRTPGAALTIMQVNRISGKIRVCAGTGTYLDPDVTTSAMAVMSDKDVAIVVVMAMTYTPYLGLTARFTGAAASALRGYTVAVQASNVQLC
ncbi:hypothetical protein [Methylobacterium sp. JK268]